MNSAPTVGNFLHRNGSAVYLPDSRGAYSVSGMVAIERSLLPSDPIGTADISFSGVKAGSEIKVYSQAGALLGGTESASGTPVFALPRYSSGNSNNTIRILIIGLGYEVLDLTYTITGDASIPVFQRIDRNYRNPT